MPSLMFRSVIIGLTDIRFDKHFQMRVKVISKSSKLESKSSHCVASA